MVTTKRPGPGKWVLGGSGMEVSSRETEALLVLDMPMSVSQKQLRVEGLTLSGDKVSRK